ncbi:MAG: SCO family protein [Flavobacteriales bacterium]|nr:SCO family protein [Flavobacteriales bacterium]
MIRKLRENSVWVILIWAFYACNPQNTEGSQSSGDAPLPYFGESDIELRRMDDGSSRADTVQYTIPKFSFTNQAGQSISHHDYEGKIFVAEFFFTECPGICPIMSSQMARLQEMVKKEKLETAVGFVSFSVKPDRDTPEVLKAYGDQLGADYSNWNFLTGKAEDIYDLAENGFMLSAFPSDTAEGGIFHTDKLSLIDRGMHIRGYYDGTSTKSVDQLFHDLKKLTNEK